MTLSLALLQLVYSIQPSCQDFNMEQIIDFDSLGENEDSQANNKQNFISPWGNFQVLHSRPSLGTEPTRYRVRSLVQRRMIIHDQQPQNKILKPSSFLQGQSCNLQEQAGEKRRVSLHNRSLTLENSKKTNSSVEVITQIEKPTVGVAPSFYYGKAKKPCKAINIHEQFLRRLNIPFCRRNLRIEQNHLPMIKIISLGTSQLTPIGKPPQNTAQFQ